MIRLNQIPKTHMTYEQETPHSQDPSRIAGNLHQDNHELMRQGMTTLLENVASLQEGNTDPSAVKAHLRELLVGDDSTEHSPVRMAAYELMSQEQAAEIDRSNAELSESFLDNTIIQGDHYTEVRQRHLGAIGTTFQAVQNRFHQGIGNPIGKGSYNSGNLTQSVDEISVVAREIPTDGEALLDAVGAWGNSHVDQSTIYRSAMSDSYVHKKALAEGSEVVAQGYEGESRDLSSLISEDVLGVVADKLTDASDDPQQGAEELTADASEPYKTPDTLDALVTMMNEYSNESNGIATRVMNGDTQALGVLEGKIREARELGQHFRTIQDFETAQRLTSDMLARINTAESAMGELSINSGKVEIDVVKSAKLLRDQFARYRATLA
jgi:hypothetical protein